MADLGDVGTEGAAGTGLSSARSLLIGYGPPPLADAYPNHAVRASLEPSRAHWNYVHRHSVIEEELEGDMYGGGISLIQTPV